MWQNRNQDAQLVRDRAAALLASGGALAQLSAQDAQIVVDYLRPHRVAAGTVVIQAGSGTDDHAMSLILSGEATVETHAGNEGIVVSVLGPGSLMGEMGLVDQAARSATCTATTDLALGILTRAALTRMIDEQPAVAARLLLLTAKHIADHLREANRKLQAMTSVSGALQQELDAVHAVNKRLLEQVDARAQVARKEPG
ncbi:MAG TPA: cyclic nucleotide-binding domain-containing protein [Ottowia sp.]|uniref:Crp/Fnr family transcriptional regulator n=1 Tax=Ottowia sp. TaxID=1898956 RepID=UPI002CB11375|nr:cyclic nucleotide-binding domain-containing protein [Ottowia sp.]HMN22655.1 cyclic nucleotide-binding domain-containing protein [Ottowia sp.]